MSHKTSYKFALGLLPLLGLLAGCSSNSTAADGNTVVFWSTGSQGMNNTLTALAKKFTAVMKEKTGVDVKVELSVEGSYDDIATKLSKGLSIGNVPTMAVAYPDTVANLIASEPAPESYVYNIDSYMNDAEIGFTKQPFLGDTSDATKEDIVPSFLKEGSSYSREGTYSYPFMKSSEVMFYNRDNLEKAYRFYKPEINTISDMERDLKSLSWDEFMDLCKVVSEHKAQILSTLETPLWYDSDSNLFITQMYQRGIPYSSIEADGKGKIDFESGENRTEAENMVKALKAERDAGLITTKGIENSYGSDAFKTGKVLFSVGSSGGTGYNMPSDVTPDKIGVCKVPAAKKNPLYVSQGPTITFIKNPSLSDEINTSRSRLAWQFAKFLTNPDNNVRLCIEGSEGYLPIRYSAYDTEAYASYLEEGEIYAASARVLIDEINGRYYNSPVFPGSAQLRDQVGTIITTVLKDGKDIKTAFDTAITTTKTAM